MCPMSKVHPVLSHAAKAPGPSPHRPPHLSRAGRVRDTDQNDWGFPPICSDHMCWAAAWCSVTFQEKWRREDGGREVGGSAYLSRPWVQDARAGRHTPWDLSVPIPQSKEGGSLPRSSHLDISSRSSQLSLDNPVKALANVSLHCTVSVIKC